MPAPVVTARGPQKQGVPPPSKGRPTRDFDDAPPRGGLPNPSEGQPPPAPSSAPSSQPSAAPVPRPFNHEAAHAALREKGALARVHCRGRSGPKAVTATVFFNPAGAVQRIAMDPQIAASPSALCVQMTLGSARVPPFDGDAAQQVTTTVGIE
jgi:hypothetical protein